MRTEGTQVSSTPQVKGACTGDTPIRVSVAMFTSSGL